MIGSSSIGSSYHPNILSFSYLIGVSTPDERKFMVIKDIRAFDVFNDLRDFDVLKQIRSFHVRDK